MAKGTKTGDSAQVKRLRQSLAREKAKNAALAKERAEALEQQAAAAEILKVISRSPSDVQPVFDAIARSARRLFGAYSATVIRRVDDILHLVAFTATTKSGDAALRKRFPTKLVGQGAVGQAILSRKPAWVADFQTSPAYSAKFRREVRERGYRSLLAVPMIRDGEAIGALTVTRREPGSFDRHQIDLLKIFADQAVIAIENVRLFNETKEALEQQTATSEVLQVISSSPTDVAPVYRTILDNVTRLCEANIAALFLYDGEFLTTAAHHNATPEFASQLDTLRVRPSHETPSRLAALERRVVHVEDALSDATLALSPAHRQEGARTILSVPLLREGGLVGVITVWRREARLFTDKQVALVKTFADQAVIAIENVRLFNETKEALERQTATAEILQVIGSSPTDTQPVFDAIVNSGVRLFPGAMITVARPHDGTVRAAAIAHEDNTMVAGWRERFTTPLSRDRLHAAAILDAKLIDFPDAEAEKDGPLGPGVQNFLLSGNRAVTIMPMLRGDGAIGAISVTRAVPGPLGDKQIAILRTFADQAVIAIENVRLFNETKEALERQTATADILKVIASSPSDVQPVFDAIVDSVARLFGRKAALRTLEAEGLKRRARSYEPTPGEFHGPDVEPLDRNSIVGTAILEGRAMQWADTLVDGAAHYGMEKAKSLSFRSIASAPLMREGKPLGVISVSSPEAGTLSDKEMELLSTFADQAVIAIENVRLFNETKEALERQTATAEILKVIASSPSDVQPVFDAIVRSATVLINGFSTTLTLVADGKLTLQAFTSTPGSGEQALHQFFPIPVQGTQMGEVVQTRRPSVIVDTESSDSEEQRILARARGFRSVVFVPLIRGDAAVGTLNVTRREPGVFSDHQIGLLKTFADQAVIAIENVRLFNETKEALERQTATAEILKVISRSPTDVQPVFDAIVGSAFRLLACAGAGVLRREGDGFRLVAMRSANPAVTMPENPRLVPIDPAANFPSRVFVDRKMLHIPDWLAIELPVHERGVFESLGVRSSLLLPMIRGDECIGVLFISRTTAGAYADQEITLMRSFVDQAMIAIENVRLFKELEERTSALGKSVEKLTAMGEVGQAISSTLDLEIVLKTIATHAVKLTGLDGASIYEYDEAAEEFRLQVADSMAPEFLQAIRGAPIRKGDGTVGGVAITLEPAQVPDILDDSYHSSRKELLVGAGYRAVLTVPLVREDHIIGALNVTRKTPGPFSDEIVELLKTFGTQSAMAIQNARLFREIEEKGKQLEEASRHKSQFLASMSHELRTPLNAILGFNEMILGDVYGEVPPDMKEPLTDIQTSGKHLLRLINNVLDLAKIEAGRMELAVDDYSVHDTVEGVRATLRPLAEAKGLELAVSVPPDLPLARGDGGRITQCLMNLAGNSLKFTKQGSVGISVALNNGTLTYKVQDTGIGIPPDKIGSLFTEFKQTDATIASEYGGTGLGLSITRKFIEMHGGRIWAESEPGSGSTFIFEVPLRTGEAGEP